MHVEIFDATGGLRLRRLVKPMNDCATCGTLPDSITANTGRDEGLPGAVRKLKRLWDTSGSNDVNAMLCPTCGAWFEWSDDTAWTGSGNNDTQTLKRLPPEAWVVLEQLLHGDVADAAAVVEAAGRHLSKDLRSRAFAQLSDATFSTMLPALFEAFRSPGGAELDQDEWFRLLRRVETRPPLRSQYLALAKASATPLSARAKQLVGLCEAQATKQP